MEANIGQSKNAYYAFWVRKEMALQLVEGPAVCIVRF